MVEEYLKVKEFVLGAGDDEDPDSDISGVAHKARKRAIAEFYKICADPKFNRDDITKHLRRMKLYGGNQAVLTEEDWNKIQVIRETTRLFFCPDQKY